MTRCGCEGAGGCQCFLSGSACLAVTGAGSSASPYVLTPVISADVDNDLSCRADGLFAAPKLKTAEVVTSETETNTAYDDMTTVGPAVTLTTGAAVRVTVSCIMSNSSVNGTSFMSFAVSGADVVAAADDRALAFTSPTANAALGASRSFIVAGLTPGSHTFTAKYKVGSGTGAYSNRQIIVERVELIP